MPGEVMVFDGVAATMCGDVALVAWRAPATVERGAKVGAFCEANLVGDGTFVLTQLILPTSSPPDGPARAQSKQVLQRLAPKLRRIISVPLGDALWATIVRTIMRGMLMLLGGMELHRVGASVGEGIDLSLEQPSPRSPTRAQMDASVGALFAALGVERPPVRTH